MKYECVVFSRTSPKQKVQILRLLKDKNIKTLAVGDGANDVNMIQEADVGIGIIGEEGKQAINASDYAVPSFKYLKFLLFHYGRMCYYQNSLFILTFMYKNFLVTFMQLYFAFQSYFTIKNFYPDWYQSLYNLFFTGFFIPATALVNRDIPPNNYKENKLLIESYLYYQGQCATLFNVKKFLFWLGAGILESAFIYFMLKLNMCTYYHYYQQASNDMFSFSIFFAVFCQHLVKVLFITWEYRTANLLFLVFSFVCFFTFVFSTDHSATIGYFKNVSKTLSISMFWLNQLFIQMSLLFINTFYFGFKRFFLSSTKDIIRQE